MASNRRRLLSTKKLLRHLMSSINSSRRFRSTSVSCAVDGEVSVMESSGAGTQRVAKKNLVLASGSSSQLKLKTERSSRWAGRVTGCGTVLHTFQHGSFPELLLGQPRPPGVVLADIHFERLRAVVEADRCEVWTKSQYELLKVIVAHGVAAEDSVLWWQCPIHGRGGRRE